MQWMLVTGGAGFIGANFALDTLRRYPDAQVTVLDALTYDLVDRLVSECDTVVHLAAESHVDNSIHDPSPFIRSNIIGTFTLLEAVRRHERRLHPTIRPLLRGQRPKLYGAGVNVREWTHVDDHNDAVHRIITDGRIGHTYLVGSGDERSNKQIVELILDLMGHPSDAFDHVADRPGHDLRYSNDSTKLRTELGWQPRYGDFRAGLAATIDWYRSNEWWWKPQKADTEAKYEVLGR